jgi:hypothetical protein
MSNRSEAPMGSCSVNALAACCMSLLITVVVSAAPAAATPLLVGFDGYAGYGFDPNVPVYQPLVQAAVPGNEYLSSGASEANGNPVELFALIDASLTTGAWLEQCLGGDPSCVQSAIIYTVWDVEINDQYPGVGTDPLNVWLFLSTEDPRVIFDGVTEMLLHDSQDMTVTTFANTVGPDDYYFLGFDLGLVTPTPEAGPDARLSFVYEIHGDLPLNPATGGPLAPSLGTGATIMAAVPEPGSGVLALIGLGGLAVLGRTKLGEIDRK